MIINYDDIVKLNNLVLDKMELILNDEFEIVLECIADVIKNTSNIKQVFLLKLTYKELTLQIELINYEGELLFIDFEKNPSDDVKLDQINLGYTNEDKKVLTNLHFDEDITNSKCLVSSNILKEKYQKYNIKPTFFNYKFCYN